MKKAQRLSLLLQVCSDTAVPFSMQSVLLADMPWTKVFICKVVHLGHIWSLSAGLLRAPGFIVLTAYPT